MSFLKTLGKVAGGVGGFVLGGPAGAYAGYKLGDAVTGGGGGEDPGTRRPMLTGTRRTTLAYATRIGTGSSTR
jgi:hypothetical protein